MSVGVFDGIEFAGVEFLVEIGDSIVCDTKETLVDASKQAVFGKLPTSLSSPFTTDIDPSNLTVSRQSDWGHITLFSDHFQNPVIGGLGHPFGGLSHLVFGWVGSTHSNTDIPE